MFYIISVVLRYCYSDRLSYSDGLIRKKDSNLRHTVLVDISYCNNSIQIVTTSALQCSFETFTWFVVQQEYINLAVKQAFASS